jgi:RNA polymerase sigma factor (TIGR02999 family)
MVGSDSRHDSADGEPADPASRPENRAGPDPGNVTRILSQIQSGDSAAAEQLLPFVYDELRRLAAAKMAQEHPGQTLQATALVHEAYIRLVDSEQARQWDSRGHFFAAAATAMRRILVEAARRKAGPEAGGSLQRHQFTDGDQVTYPISDELLDLDAALTRLGMADPQAAEIVQLRVFGCMTVEEVAQHQEISPRTVKRTWAYARAWLAREIHR